MEQRNETINFSCRISAEYLFNLINGINGLIAEGTFIVNSEGIKLTAMDPANVSMVVLNMPKDKFIELNGQYRFRVILKDMLNLLKTNKKAVLNISSNADHKIFLEFSNGFKGFIREIEDDESKDQRVPGLDFNTILKVNPKQIKEAVKSISAIGDSSLFNYNNGFVIESKTTNQAIDYTEIKGNTARSSYSTEYLLKMLNIKADSCIISFNSEFPLKVEYADYGLVFILAPRVMNE